MEIKKIKKFETIVDGDKSKLLGGFSRSFSNEGSNSNATISNNCMGGNCTSGCGSGRNQSCNYIAGCGVVFS